MEIKNIAIHHTAVAKGRQKYQLRAVNRYHKDKWNMISNLNWYIGYNYFIDTHGVVTNTRQIGEETMAQKGHNFDTISICLAGNFNEEYPSWSQNASLRYLIRRLKEQYPNVNITTHRDLQENRVCPGNLFTDEYMTSILTEPTPEEKEKQTKIMEMQSTIDILIDFIANRFKGRN